MPRYSLGGCTKCKLSRYRKRIVEYRGHLPADVLFVGEAPGTIEDAYGQPFVGPSGDLLDYIIHLTQRTLSIYFDVEHNEVFTFCITNTVQCIPKQNGKIRPPELQEKQACSSRLQAIVSLAKPKLVVALGEEAANWLKSEDNPVVETILNFHAPVTHLYHPAYILRQPKEDQTPLIHKSVSQLLGFLETRFLEATL